MEISRNEKVLELEEFIDEYQLKIQKSIADLNDVINKKEIIEEDLQNMTLNEDKRRELAESLELLQNGSMGIEYYERLLEIHKTKVDNAIRKREELLPTNLEKAQYIAWLKYQKIKPRVNSVANTFKDLTDNVKSKIDDIDKEKIKEKFLDGVEDFKEKKSVQNLSERAKIVKNELNDLNLYKIIGQVKKNVSESLEDIQVYIKNNKVDEKVKTEVDKYITPEVKGKVSSFIGKIKTGLDEAVEVITDNTEDEDEAAKREKNRKMKGVKENYLKSWIREHKIQVVKNSTERNSINDIYNDYIDFMFSEYGQEKTSKLIINDYNEFVKSAAKFLNLPIIFNSDVGTINLFIGKNKK